MLCAAKHPMFRWRYSIRGMENTNCFGIKLPVLSFIPINIVFDILQKIGFTLSLENTMINHH